MSTFALAGIQLHARGVDQLDAMEAALKQALLKYPWLQMVLFSELCAFGPAPRFAQPMPGPAEERFCQWAKTHGIWLVPGSIFEKDGDRTCNTTPVINPQGEVVGRYRKIYPFLPYEAGISPGDTPLVFDVPGAGRFGVSICYDMWFAETTRALVWEGAEVILHPTMTTTGDRDIEHAIVQASAACNQVYFVDINGAGGLGVGQSTIVSPEGYVLQRAGEDFDILALEVDFDLLRRTRERGLRNLGQPLKSFRDHRPAFAPYQPGAKSPALDQLGPLKMPGRPES